MHTIHATLDHPDAAPGNRNLYCFTDPATGLVGEPLMEEATSVIQHLFIFNDEQPGPVTILFTDDEAEAAATEVDSGFLCTLSDPQPARDGTDYTLVVTYPRPVEEAFNCGQAFLGAYLTVWLCPALLRYFPAVPSALNVWICPE
ncbi:hypothetical protein VB738_12720 [Cyanobium gracile UHCC 0139]|uniref:Uncharacterized protein n=1 Tax=Cyanobium gracile UHCC 0139 TaxID=3110308 RepID=A0ABU5RWG8_9CYAN|nr:hypothetical protein [Cyanobium gracile]MEA5392122.1 hypothetical protein [Cyanobium gracile UHCC 0139]